MDNTVPNSTAQIVRLPIRIDGDRAVELLTEVIKDVGPDHVYDGPRTEISGLAYEQGAPRYVDDKGCAACLVARALVIAGVDEADLAAHEGVNIAVVLDDFKSRGILAIDWKACDIFITAQDAQDEGRRWGRALAEARAAVA